MEEGFFSTMPVFEQLKDPNYLLSDEALAMLEQCVRRVEDQISDLERRQALRPSAISAEEAERLREEIRQLREDNERLRIEIDQLRSEAGKPSVEEPIHGVGGGQRAPIDLDVDDVNEAQPSVGNPSPPATPEAADAVNAPQAGETTP